MQVTAEAEQDGTLELFAPRRRRPVYSPQGTALPRHVSAILDNVIAILVSVLAAKQLPESWLGTQVIVLVLTYLTYYFVFEFLFSTTPGKFLNGLAVRDFDGGRCTLRQTAIRTAFRVLEVNPVFLGGLPAAASILWSRDKQRLGDKIAGTVVVFR